MWYALSIMSDETEDPPVLLLETNFVPPEKIPGRRLPVLDGRGRDISLALIGGGVVVGGIILGISLPDVDQNLSFLDHRSALTHSILIPYLLRGHIRRLPLGQYLYAGVMAGLAIHMASDLFPKDWVGYALIAVPIIGRMDPIFSILWLSANVAFALGAAAYSTSGTNGLFNDLKAETGRARRAVCVVIDKARTTREYVRDRDPADIAGDCLENVAKAASKTVHATDEKVRVAAKKARAAREYVRSRDPADIAGDCLETAEHGVQKATDAALKAGEIVRNHKITKVVTGKTGQYLEKAGQALQKV